jgi:hypothetical protein
LLAFQLLIAARIAAIHPYWCQAFLLFFAFLLLLAFLQSLAILLFAGI